MFYTTFNLIFSFILHISLFVSVTRDLARFSPGRSGTKFSQNLFLSFFFGSIWEQTNKQKQTDKNKNKDKRRKKKKKKKNKTKHIKKKKNTNV